jgi:hypothetical protein|tara:strand:+ start:14765 stop:15076 length:312 start_codon:yes stop_codon:yes gene_type:complete
MIGELLALKTTVDPAETTTDTPTDHEMTETISDRVAIVEAAPEKLILVVANRVTILGAHHQRIATMDIVAIAPPLALEEAAELVTVLRPHVAAIARAQEVRMA